MKGRTIARLAAEAGVNVETIRYYERIGVLDKPSRSQTGWRQYSEHVLETLKYVRAGQQLGFSLGEIKSVQRLCLVQEPPGICQSIREIARQKISEVDQQILGLEQLKKRLQEFIQACSIKPDAERCPMAKAFRGMKHGSLSDRKENL
ncbi:MAG TPA: MerR family transcriptional regulator [Candidatus Angelobacter sp.]|nr:MerR family transcriptional regulator [Candidatus Angelobacter sp.]